MLLVFWVLLAFFTLSESNIVKENTTQITDRCNDDLQKTIVNKMELLEAGIDNLIYSLNTLNIIVDQLFKELQVAIANIPNQNDTEHRCSSSADKQCDGLETTKPVQTKQTGTFNPNSIPSKCHGRQNGTQLIQIPNSKLEPFHVYCIEDPQPDGDPWILIQRRRNGNVDFYRNWSDYKHGFGNLEDEFFIGLEKLHALSHYTLHELWIQMENIDNEKLWARYSSFAIGDESESYALNVLGSFTGNAGDSLEYHAGQKFTTKDVDNDIDEDNNCATIAAGGWWYKDCYESNLNGKYYDAHYSLIKIYSSRSPIVWKTWYHLKYVHMAIRPLH